MGDSNKALDSFSGQAPGGRVEPERLRWEKGGWYLLVLLLMVIVALPVWVRREMPWGLVGTLLAVLLVLEGSARRQFRKKAGLSQPGHNAPGEEATPPVVELSPRDEHNEVLLTNVHPPKWQNPEPLSRYNLVVIGGGTAGLVTAAGA